MSTNEHDQHIVPLRTYLIILGALITLTLLSIAITQIDLGPWTMVGAMLFAVVKSSLIVYYFMHLKFENKMYAIFGGVVMLTFAAVIILTFLDYMFQ
jgi:cytochrome c oxidase subunit 4